ncbi:hypothetical protein NLU13_7148 [Sarocladium strictum]|uniref:Uncharacterized protein n=1 Tax=Sarocladium strictum TaxID=5046 RepID=A0AA39GGB2_SARSR|nr:hypothetical protein NLU13_7148 [Sarocladium strictum]
MHIQKTFTIVPPVSRDASPIPGFTGGRMTSKQVKDAYKTANKGPRMSRAERLQMERAEQQRIRREMEKEKASAKARLLRDKKKEREMAEREVKRRQGKPLVSVRPSQDTIARFVRGNGTDRKRDCQGSTITQCPSPQTIPLQKDLPQPNAILESVASNVDSYRRTTELHTSARSVSSSSGQKAVPKPTPDPSGLDESGSNTRLGDNLLSDSPQDQQNSVWELKDSSRVEETRTAPVDATLAAVMDEDLDTDLSQEALAGAQPEDRPKIPDQLPQLNLDQLDQFFDEDPEIDTFEELHELKDTPVDAGRSRLSGFMQGSAAQTHTMDSNSEECCPGKRICQVVPAQVLQPGTASVVQTEQRQSQKVPDKQKPNQPPVFQAPPSSTQVIMMNPDDFFPTASQLARELDQDTLALDALVDSMTPSQSMPPPPPPRIMTPSARKTADQSPITPMTPKMTRAMIREPGLDPARDVVLPHLRTTSSPSTPPRWFTASGSKELESLALQRSRRTAALQELQLKERRRSGVSPSMGEAKPKSSSPATLEPISNSCARVSPSKRESCSNPLEKENIPPNASQETDYGGGWMEDFEL